MVTGQNNSMSEEMRLIYSVVTLIAIIVFFKLLIDSDGSYVFLAEGLGLAAYLIILALILLLENILAIGALAGAIIIIGILVIVGISGSSSKESAGSTSSGGGGSTSHTSVSGNGGVKAESQIKIQLIHQLIKKIVTLTIIILQIIMKYWAISYIKFMVKWEIMLNCITE